MKIGENGWTRSHNGFVPAVMYKTREEAREAIKFLWNRKEYKIIKAKFVKTNERAGVGMIHELGCPFWTAISPWGNELCFDRRFTSEKLARHWLRGYKPVKVKLVEVA